MKRLLIAAALALPLFSPQARADNAQDFTLINTTGFALSEVYISPSKEDHWGDDLLENDDESMDDGETRTIHFTGFKGVCHFDLKVVYEEDDSDAVWNDVDLCKVSKISLFWNKKTNVTSAVFD